AITSASPSGAASGHGWETPDSSGASGRADGTRPANTFQASSGRSSLRVYSRVFVPLSLQQRAPRRCATRNSPQLVGLQPWFGRRFGSAAAQLSGTPSLTPSNNSHSQLWQSSPLS